MAYKYDASVAKQQSDLNAANQGKAGYVPLKVDGLLGPKTQAAITQYGFNAQTGKPNTPIVGGAPGSLPTLGGIPGVDEAPKSNLGNLRLALNAALTESAQQTAKNRIGQLSGLMGGGANPSVLKAAVGLAQGGLAQSRESIMSDVLKTYDEERKRLEFNPDQFRSAQGGIYDLKNNSWVISPSPDGDGTGKKITRTDATVLKLPISLVGKSWNMLQTELDNDNPPQWFLDIAAQEKKGQAEDEAEAQKVRDAINVRFDAGDKEGARALAHAYNQKRAGVTPAELRAMWDKFREQFLGTFSDKSGGVDFED